MSPDHAQAQVEREERGEAQHLPPLLPPLVLPPICLHQSALSIVECYCGDALAAKGLSRGLWRAHRFEEQDEKGEPITLSADEMASLLEARHCWSFFSVQHDAVHTWAHDDAELEVVIHDLTRSLGPSYLQRLKSAWREGAEDHEVTLDLADFGLRVRLLAEDVLFDAYERVRSARNVERAARVERIKAASVAQDEPRETELCTRSDINHL